MADLVFKQGIAAQVNGIGFTKTADNIISAGGGVGGVQNRDVVRIVYTDVYQKAVYAICTDQNLGTFQFDDNIYPVGLSSFTGTVYQYNSTDVHEVSAYKISANVENGLYSKAYLQYDASITYNLIVPSKRNNYFDATDVIITQSNVVFADLCDNKAYGVGLSEGTFEFLNNRYKSSLEFNIATR